MSSIPLAPVLGPWLSIKAFREQAVGRVSLGRARPLFPMLSSVCHVASGNTRQSQALAEGGLLSPQGPLHFLPRPPAHGLVSGPTGPHIRGQCPLRKGVGTSRAQSRCPGAPPWAPPIAFKSHFFPSPRKPSQCHQGCVSNSVASLGHTGRRVVLGHALNTQTLMKTVEQNKGFK